MTTRNAAVLAITSTTNNSPRFGSLRKRSLTKIKVDTLLSRRSMRTRSTLRSNHRKRPGRAPDPPWCRVQKNRRRKILGQDLRRNKAPEHEARKRKSIDEELRKRLRVSEQWVGKGRESGGPSRKGRTARSLSRGGAKRSCQRGLEKGCEAA